MSQIFARAGVPETAVGPTHMARVSALRPERRGGRVMPLLIGAVAGLAGLGAGAFIIHAPSSPAPPPVVQAAPPPAAAPPAAVADAGPPLIIPQTPVETASPAAPQPAPRPKAVHAPHVPVAHAQVAHAQVAHAQVAHAQVNVVRAPRREPEPRAVAQPASCEKNATGVGCRRAVIQADRHLRDVYERAVRRGVPRAVLVDYRDRWADLRGNASEDPAHLIEGYGALAYDLGREAKDDEEGNTRRRSPSGLHALASALVPWW